MNKSLAPLNFIFNDSEAGKLAHNIDWSKHPLGPVENWPQSLKTAVSLMLNSRFPMFISWGENRSFLYNDAYAPILGKKHPDAFGKAFQLIWSEIWTDLLPLVESVDGGKATYQEDLELVMHRNGFREVTYFTFSYSPIYDENGKVMGLHCACVETTENVLRRRQLQESEAKLAFSLESARMGLWSVDLDTNKVTHSNASRKILGFDREYENPDEAIDTFIHPDDQQYAAEVFASAFQSRRPYTDEYRILKPDGEIRWIKAQGNIRINSEQKATEMIGTVMDITDEKFTHLRLAQSERQLLEAVNVAKVGFFDWDVQKDSFTISDQFASDWGLANGATINDVLGTLHPEDREPGQILIEKAMADGQPYRAQYRVQRKTDGATLWIDAQGRALRDEHGELLNFFGTTVDITDRKESEVALRESEQNFRVLFESAPGNYLILRPDLTIAAVSDAYNEATMTKRDQILGKHVFEAFPDNPDDLNATGVSNMRASFLSVLSTKQPHTMALQKYDIRGPGGNFEEKWWSPINYPVVGTNGEVAYIIHRAEEVTEFVLKQKNAGQTANLPDNTSRVTLDLFQRAHEIQDANFRLQNTMEALSRSQEELRRAKNEAERANQLKSAFLANMSHEIRTPLGVMIGFADLITDDKIASNERKQYAQTLKRNGEQLTLLINDILDLSKVEAGHLKVEALNFSFRTLIEEVLLAMTVKAKEKGLRLTSKIDADIADELTSDPTRLRQILFNVIGNAIKFTQSGEVALSVMRSDGKLQLEVHDSGMGIAAEHQASLFKPFVQADESITRKFGGTGLGLALSKRLAQLLGGDLILKESTVGKGSTFIVIIQNDLPAVNGKSVCKSVVTESRFEPDLALEGVSILLVEDSVDNQVLISRMLVIKGAKVEIAENGLEGVEKALNGKHDLILMDVQMPVLDGYSATQRLREAGFRKPIIALTAHAMSDVRAKCMDVGYSDYLPKPINPGNLITTIARFAAETT